MVRGEVEAAEVFSEFFAPVEMDAEQAADAMLDPENGIDFAEVVYTKATEDQYQEMVRLMEEAEAEDAAAQAGEPERDGEWV